MRNEIIDLHTHTNISDGDLSPTELLEYAHKLGIKAISITDHDTTSAYTDETFNTAKRLNIELIPGIELSTKDDNGKYHILGYFIDLDDIALTVRLNGIKQERFEYASACLNLFKQDGWSVNKKELDEIKIITKAHISSIIINNPKNKTRLIKEFGFLPTIGALIEKFMLENQKYFVQRKKGLTPKEAIDLIHNASGIAILAHPTFNILNGFTPEKIAEMFLNLGIDGFEAIYIEYERNNMDKPHNYIDFFTNFSRENDLLISGGSDYHTSGKKFGKINELGFTNIEGWSVPYSILEDLKRNSN